MDPRVKQKRIPTLLAFGLLAIGVAATYILIQRGTFIVSQAAPDYTPVSVHISNVDTASFTVSFVTSDPTAAYIELADGRTIFDDRGSDTTSQTHYFTVDKLDAGSSYTFSINSHGDTYEDEAYSAMTASSASPAPEQQALSGRVLLPEGGGASQAIVYLSVNESQLVSTLTDADGTYAFDLSSGLRTQDLAGFVILEEGDRLSLTSSYGDFTSQVTAYYAVTLPPITLGRNFDFTAGDSVTDTSTQSATLSIPQVGSFSDFSVLSPEKGDFLVDSQPIVSGTAAPHTRVSLEFHPLELQTNVEVAENGRWEYRLEMPLPQGENTLQAVGVDGDGVSRIVDVAFQVFPDGSRIQQSATPSATPVVTLSPSPTPPIAVTATPAPTEAAPTPTPAPVGSEEPTATGSPTLSPSPTITPFMKITPTPPGSFGGVLLTFASLAFIVSGATLLFLLG